MRDKAIRATGVALMTVMIGSAAHAVLSEPVVVDCAYQSKHWYTLFTNEVPLAWQWMANASQARLDIKGMSYSVSLDFTTGTSSYLWHVFEAAKPAVEDVFEVVLTQYSIGNEVVGVATSRLAVVKGAFGDVQVKPVSDSAGWSKIKGDTVLAYDASWSDSAAQATGARLTIAKDGGGLSQTYAFDTVCGYYGWKLAHSEWGYGLFNLLLQFPETEGQLSAVLRRTPDGAVIWMR